MAFMWSAMRAWRSSGVFAALILSRISCIDSMVARICICMADGALAAADGRGGAFGEGVGVDPAEGVGVVFGAPLGMGFGDALGAAAEAGAEAPAGWCALWSGSDAGFCAWAPTAIRVATPSVKMERM
jgi:hypothetical protein